MNPLVPLGILAAIAGAWLFGGMFYFAFGPLGLAGFLAVVATPIVGRVWSKASKASAQRQAEDDRQAQWAAFLATFEPELHEVLYRLHDERTAAKMWAAMSLGSVGRWIGSGDNARWEPATYPHVVHIEPAAIGARVRLQMLAGQSPDHFEKRRGEIKTALNITAVRMAGDSGETVDLDLMVFDPLQGMTMSPLIDDATNARIVAAVKAARNDDEMNVLLKAACADLQLTVPVDGLSVYDDILIGPDEEGGMLTVNLAADDHLAVAGTTRAGKSVFIYNILAAAMLMRDCKVVLIDPNGATSPPWYQSAHLLCDTRDADAAVKVLEAVMAEMERRQKLLIQLRTDKITRFTKDLPLWLVVVEEASNYKDNPKFMILLEKISAQAAKYGIDLVVIAQKLSGENVPTAARAQLSGRVTLRLNDPADYRMVHPNAPQFAEDILLKSKTPQGVGIASLPCHVDPVRFRALFLPIQACFVIGDMIIAVRGEERPLPGSEPLALPPGPSATQDSNSVDTIKPPASTPRPTKATEDRPTSKLPILPKLPQFGAGRTVVPFDRTARPDPAEDTDLDSTDDQSEDTGTA
ncbi:FtsK/SpoIIIE domain-containing protein [Nocardia yunnanensis]|uniref:FtsK/SpoIIIE domain-containing protein n=1 Tax=Nocardia yunnanensis TaxID=2382165 RepID=UPI0013C4214D|nr:FtsK/SpoIIIE domain-containing protein [Nocardia yunnanensis]